MAEEIHMKRDNESLQRLDLAVQKEIGRSTNEIAFWKLLGLPIMLALLWFFSERLTVDAQQAKYSQLIFVCSIPVWIVLHTAFIARVDGLLESQAALMLERMKALSFFPSGCELKTLAPMFRHGAQLGYYYITYTGPYLPLSPPVLGAVTEYYEVCAREQCSAHPGFLAVIEWKLFNGILLLLAVTASWSALAEGWALHSLILLIVLELFAVGVYIVASLAAIRLLSLLQATASLLNTRQA